MEILRQKAPRPKRQVVRSRLLVTPWRCRLKAGFQARPEHRLQPVPTSRDVTVGFNPTLHQAPGSRQTPTANRCLRGCDCSGAFSLKFPWRLVFGVWSFVFAILLFCPSARAQTSGQYQVKAVFLFHFAQFIEWPSEAFAETNSPLVIGVLGTDPFNGILDETVRDEEVRGHRLVVERYRTVEQIKNCHILYIGQSEARRLEQDLAQLKNKPVLTVSDIEAAPERGVMIRFEAKRTRIGFAINREAAKSANLTISSKLLQAADIVGPR